jgi:hypothetical protein
LPREKLAADLLTRQDVNVLTKRRSGRHRRTPDSHDRQDRARWRSSGSHRNARADGVRLALVPPIDLAQPAGGRDSGSGAVLRISFGWLFGRGRAAP